MGDLKLFNISGKNVSELSSASMDLERSLQVVFERNLETLLGVRFLASEFVITNGRIDTLGIDENGYPVIIEYKRQRDENVINQGLFYLDWLMDHKASFELLVRDTFGKEVSDNIEWSAPRLICIASEFTKFDEHAVKQMQRNIELIRYRRFGDDLLMLDLLTVASATKSSNGSTATTSPQAYKTASEYISDADDQLSNLYQDLRTHLLGLGDDVQEKALRFYIAFKRIKNFACVEVKPQAKTVKLYLKVDPDEHELVEGFTRDVRKVGHFGTGDLEVTLRDHSDFDEAKRLIRKSYEAS